MALDSMFGHSSLCGSSVSIDKQDQKLQYVGMNLKCFINHKTLIYIIIQRVNFGYSKSTLPSSHIGVTLPIMGLIPMWEKENILLNYLINFYNPNIKLSYSTKQLLSNNNIYIKSVSEENIGNEMGVEIVHACATSRLEK